MLDLVGNPEDRFSQNEAQFNLDLKLNQQFKRITGVHYGKSRKQFFSYIDEFFSYEYDDMSDDRQQLPMNSLPESQVKGNFILYDSRSWKACLQDFRPGLVKIRRYSHIRWLVAWNCRFKQIN